MRVAHRLSFLAQKYRIKNIVDELSVSRMTQLAHEVPKLDPRKQCTKFNVLLSTLFLFPPFFRNMFIILGFQTFKVANIKR